MKKEQESLSSRLYNYNNVSKDEALLKSTTGLRKSNFDALLDFLNPGAQCENIKYHDVGKENKLNQEYTGAQKPGPKPKLGACNQLFLYLSWLKNGFTISHVSWLFNTPKATVSCYIITWTNFLYFSLGNTYLAHKTTSDSHNARKFQKYLSHNPLYY